MGISIAVVILLLTGIVWAALSEKKLWNNGICPMYNEPWVCFDTDSQGGRGYKCRDQHIWISWPVDRVRLAMNRSQR